MIRTTIAIPGALVVLLLLPGFPAAPDARLTGKAVAQELRGGLSGSFSGRSELSSAWGGGLGIRILPRAQVGVGLELDRWSFNPTVNAPVCDPDGVQCRTEPVAMWNRLETVTFLLLAEALRTEEWRLRLGFGRVAGIATGSGVSQTSGVEVEPPGADRGAGRLAWSRGADGSVVVFEVLRSLPVPGPLVPSVLASYRHHRLEMEGCVSGAFSPFCGPLNLNEFQLGLFLPLWPR